MNTCRLATALLFALVLSLLAPVVTDAGSRQAMPRARSAVHSALMHSAPQLYQATPDEGELDDLDVMALDPDLDPDDVMRLRPFILTSDSARAFPFESRRPRALSDSAARDRLARFLNKRDVDPAAVDEALDRFDDPAVIDIVPSSTLRASLLMLTDWEPYQASIDAILYGANPSGEPFFSVEFADIEFADAIATVDERRGRFRMIFDESFAGESPEQLIPVLVHESLHGGGDNSREEEVIANILDTLSYAELLLIDPRVANFGTDLALFNNVETLALINSMGRTGAGRVGISTSPLGDVFVGPDLDEFDAESIRAVIESDEFYGALPGNGSPGQETFTALIGRFPGADALGDMPDFDESALAVIDAGIGSILTPREVVRLADLLGLDLAGNVIEGPDAGPIAESLDQRPFIPADPSHFDMRYAIAADDPLDEAAGRDALSHALRARGVSQSDRADVVRLYDDDETRDLIPDPALRAALLMLSGWKPWDVTLGVVLDGQNPDDEPLEVLFANLPLATTVLRRSGGSSPAILINSWYRGERPDLLASFIVEGSLLHDDRLSLDEAVAASLLGTLAYGDLVAVEPDLAAESTGGVIRRNQDLLGLLNSTAWTSETAPVSADSVGFLGSPYGANDILPRVYHDAESFADYVASRPEAASFSRRSTQVVPPVFLSYLTYAGLESEAVDEEITFSDQTMGELDARLGVFLTPETALLLAETLDLGIAAE